jgi:hypothetical protein
MNGVFLDSLRNQQSIFDATSDACQTRTMAVFMDLCWGDAFDTIAAFRDPGIQFDMQERRLVIMRVSKEIRYYVGPNDPFANDCPQEIGILATEVAAISFAYEYLVKRHPLSEIKVERIIRSQIP